MHTTSEKSLTSIAATLGGLVAALGGIAVAIAATGGPPLLLGSLLAVCMLLLLVLGIFIGQLLRARS